MRLYYPSSKRGNYREYVQIRNTKNLEDYLQNFSNRKNNSKIILNLDLDFFASELDFIDFELKKKVILDVFEKASYVTVCTSPFFVDQGLAVEKFKEIFKEKLL